MTSVADLSTCLGLSAYALFAMLSWAPQPRVVMLPMVHPLGRCLLLALVVVLADTRPLPVAVCAGAVYLASYWDWKRRW
jgi:hypothetical protein